MRPHGSRPADLLLFAVLCVSRQAPGTGDKAFDLARGLANSVDYPDAKTRRSVAFELARRGDVTLDEWLRSAERAVALPPVPAGNPGPGLEPRSKPAPERGARTWTADLLVEGKTEKTELCVYVPFSLDTSHPAPLLLAFHGTGGNGKQTEPMWRATAEKLGMLVLAPSEAGKNEGYAFSDRERRSALEALRWMRRWYDVDENRIYATGISRGGHLAWDLALRHPDLFAAIAPMIGGPRFNLTGGQNNLRYLDNVLHLPIRDLQGMKDDPGLIANLRLAFDKLAKKKAADAKLVEFPDKGHDFDFGAVDWADFFGSARRNPVPERVVLLAARADEARAYWVEITKLGKDVAENVTPKVEASIWNALDENGKRKLLEEEIEKHTARLEVKTTGPGRFAATGERVAGFRLLLSASMFDPAKPVQVNFNGKFFEKKVKPDPKVLLYDFVERFDRSFLPIAAVDVP
jgi:dienelactone hydrolase